MIAKLYLGLLATIFIAYGMYCLVSPEMLAGAAGVAANSLTGTIELRAMYGGLQIAVGALCLYGALSPVYRRAVMVALLFIFAGLAVPRVGLGLVHGDHSAYTLFAMVFELGSALLLAWLLTRSRAAA
jgi:hypothetical protein